MFYSLKETWIGFENVNELSKYIKQAVWWISSDMVHLAVNVDCVLCMVCFLELALGYWEKQIEDKSLTWQLFALPLERVSMQYGAQVWEQRTDDSPRAEEQAGPRWRWGVKFLLYALRQKSNVQSLVKGEFRNDLFTTTLHAVRVVSSTKVWMRNFLVWCERKKTTSSVCVTMLRRAMTSVV